MIIRYLHNIGGDFFFSNSICTYFYHVFVSEKKKKTNKKTSYSEFSTDFTIFHICSFPESCLAAADNPTTYGKLFFISVICRTFQKNNFQLRFSFMLFNDLLRCPSEVEIENPTGGHSWNYQLYWRSKPSPKGLRRSLGLFVWNYEKRLTFRARTANVTSCANVTLFLHATSSELSPIVAFSLCRFLALYRFKFFFLPLFLGTTLRKHAYSNILKISPPK